MDIFFDKPIRQNEKTRLSIYLDREQKEQLRLISIRECISLNNVARTFLEAMTREYSKASDTNHPTYDTETPWLFD